MDDPARQAASPGDVRLARRGRAAGDRRQGSRRGPRGGPLSLRHAAETRGMDKQMTSQAKGTGPRVGLFGLLGSGNIGNDASTEAVVNYLRTDYPDAVIDAMCMGADRMRERYGIETVPIQWQSARKLPGGPLGAGLKVLGKVLDIGRTAAWVRRHDAVIIPGMGIM